MNNLLSNKSPNSKRIEEAKELLKESLLKSTIDIKPRKIKNFFYSLSETSQVANSNWRIRFENLERYSELVIEIIYE